MLRTDDRGIYRIFGLRPGKYRVAAGQDEGNFGSRGGGYRRTFHPDATEASKATIIEVTEGSEATNVDITLPEPIVYYSAYGRIIDGDTGQPLANLSYGAHKQAENYGSSLTTGAVSNKDGEFRLENLSPGKYSVFVEVPPNSDYRVDYVRFDVVDRDVTGLIVKTTRGASVSGSIVVEGADNKTINEMLRSARVHAQVSNQDSTRSSNQSATINPDGSFRIGGLSSGVVNFHLWMQRFHIVRVERAGMAQHQGIELREREQITGVRLIVNYANGSIQGAVKLDGGSIPPNGRLSVSLKRLGELPTPFSDSGNSAQVDARGGFVAEGLLPGTYQVTAIYSPDLHTPWRQATEQVVVTNGTTANVTLNVDSNVNPGRP
jgi:hypothetical protein